MYENVGKKIMSLIKIITSIGIGFSVLIGILIVAFVENGSLQGILIAIIGSFIFWISGIVIYAFGRISDDIGSMLEVQNKLLNIIQNNNINILTKSESKEEIEDKSEIDESKDLLSQLKKN